MVHEHKHLIIVHLNSTGFSVEDIVEIRPDFEAPSGNDRPVRYELQWDSCAMGPCSYTISVIIYAAIGAISTGFLAALGADLYKWSRDRLQKVFSKRLSGEGDTIIQFDDKSIRMDFHPSEESFAEVWRQLPDLVCLIEDSECKAWRVTKNEFGKLALEEVIDH